MPRFHVNSKGEARACAAQKGQCPFGGEENHYPSPENARQAYELSSAAQTFAPGKSKPARRELISGKVERIGKLLRPRQEVETEVNAHPSCFTPEADRKLRDAVAHMYEWAAEGDHSASAFQVKEELVFSKLEEKYRDDGMSDSEPRWYWKDHMANIQKLNGWAD